MVDIKGHSLNITAPQLGGSFSNNASRLDAGHVTVAPKGSTMGSFDLETFHLASTGRFVEAGARAGGIRVQIGEVKHAGGNINMIFTNNFG